MDDWVLFVSNCFELALFEGFREPYLTALIKALLLDLISSFWSQK